MENAMNLIYLSNAAKHINKRWELELFNGMLSSLSSVSKHAEIFLLETPSGGTIYQIIHRSMLWGH